MKISSAILSVLCFSSIATVSAASETRTSNAGLIQAPKSGSVTLTMEQVPASIRHTAEVALKSYNRSYAITRAQIDYDDIEAVYEIQAKAADGRFVEVDISMEGRVMELELEITKDDVPAEVSSALSRLVPNFAPSQETPAIEKSLRPSSNGMLEVWYEFSGTQFDVEVSSDAKYLLIEPA